MALKGEREEGKGKWLEWKEKGSREGVYGVVEGERGEINWGGIKGVIQGKVKG